MLVFGGLAIEALRYTAGRYTLLGDAYHMALPKYAFQSGSGEMHPPAPPASPWPSLPWSRPAPAQPALPHAWPRHAAPSHPTTQPIPGSDLGQGRSTAPSCTRRTSL